MNPLDLIRRLVPAHRKAIMRDAMRKSLPDIVAMEHYYSSRELSVFYTVNAGLQILPLPEHANATKMTIHIIGSCTLDLSLFLGTVIHLVNSFSPSSMILLPLSKIELLTVRPWSKRIIPQNRVETLVIHSISYPWNAKYYSWCDRMIIYSESQIYYRSFTAKSESWASVPQHLECPTIIIDKKSGSSSIDTSAHYEFHTSTRATYHLHITSPIAALDFITTHSADIVLKVDHPVKVDQIYLGDGVDLILIGPITINWLFDAAEYHSYKLDYNHIGVYQKVTGSPHTFLADSQNYYEYYLSRWRQTGGEFYRRIISRIMN